MAEGRRKNIINLQLEVDVTELRGNLARHRQETGKHISLTAWIAGTLAATVDEDRSIQAYRKGKSRLIIFDEVDLAVMIERDMEDGPMPIVSIIRSANSKSMSDIQQEMKSVRTEPLGQNGPLSALENCFFRLPTWLRKIIWFFIRRDPSLFKQLAGTVGITSMGMHAGGPMILIPITPMTLTLSIGSIGKDLVLREGLPVEREILRLNLGADHDIIDGAPLVRFADRFREKLEEGRIETE